MSVKASHKLKLLHVLYTNYRKYAAQAGETASSAKWMWQKSTNHDLKGGCQYDPFINPTYNTMGIGLEIL